MTLTDTVKTTIAEQYQNGKSFTVNDFKTIMDEFGANRRSVTEVLREFVRKNKLRVVGEEMINRGGSARKIYCIVNDIDLTPKEKVSRKIVIQRKESHSEKCCFRLESAMRKWI